MEPIQIGLNAAGRRVAITPAMRQSTHMHVIGGSGTGKSKFLEWMIRKDIRAGHGFCLVDWHGTLYADVLRYCAQLDVGLHKDFRKVILLNPSQPDYVSGFNPFMNQGADISTQVSRRIDATIRPWGITDTNLMPTFERICRLLYTFAVEQRETLPNAAQLLQFDKPELREFAIQQITDPYIKQQWQQLARIKSFRDWREFVLSTENRLGRFLSSKTIKRFMGLTEGNIDLVEAMNQGSIILLNLGSSGFLDREAARVFASLLLNEFFESAMLRATQSRHGEKPKTFNLYLDEFQEYITDDIGSMLDQVRKGGLHMVLAHQHLGHLADNQKLLQSILTNARIRAVFGGLSYADASLLANEMFLPDLNERQIKKAYYHTIHLYEEQKRTVQSTSRGSGTSESRNWTESTGSSTSKGTGHSSGVGSGHNAGFSSTFGSGRSSGSSISAPGGALGSIDTEGWFTESEGNSEFSASGSSESFVDFSSEGDFESLSETSSESSSWGGASADSQSQSSGESIVPVWVPIPVQELGSEAEWGREEKVSRVAEMLKTQQQRHCFIKLDTEKTQPMQIPLVKDPSLSQARLEEYEQEVYTEQGALDGLTVDHMLEESETRFLRAAQETIDITPSESKPAISAPNAKPAGRSARKSLFATIKKPT